jgi:hypothetical protein
MMKIKEKRIRNPDLIALGELNNSSSTGQSI